MKFNHYNKTVSVDATLEHYNPISSRPEAGEEGGDDVKSAWPFDALGYTHVTMAMTMGCQPVRGS